MASYFNVNFHQNAIVAKRGEASLRLEDFKSLFGKEWLSTSLMGYVVEAVRGLGQSLYAGGGLSTNIMGARYLTNLSRTPVHLKVYILPIVFE